jgi:hypothetical protein
MKSIMRSLSLLVCLNVAFMPSAFAGEVSTAVKVSKLRAYSNSAAVGIVEFETPVVCNTTAFRIDLIAPGGKEMYATLLTALTTGKKVQVEVSNGTGCTGWGTYLQSVFMWSS